MRSYAAGGFLLFALVWAMRARNVFTMRTVSRQVPRRISFLKCSSSSALLLSLKSSTGMVGYWSMSSCASSRERTGRSLASDATGKLIFMG